MRRHASLLLLAVLLLPGALPARADTSAPAAAAEMDRAAQAERIGAAFRLLKAEKGREALALIGPLRDELEDDDDAELRLAVYDLLGYAGALAGDRAAEIQGNTQSVLLNALLAPLDAPDTVAAELTLAESYRRSDLRLAQFHVLANVLAAVEGARRAGPLSPDMEETEAAAATLLAQTLRAEGRVELALAFFRRADALARKGRMEPLNAGKLEAVIADMAAQPALVSPPLPAGTCIGSPALTAEAMAACRRAADHAFAQGDTGAAETILAGLLADVPAQSLRPDRAEAARDLLLLRQLTRPARDPELLASADLVANYLASINEVTTAALIGARLARTAIDSGSHDAQVAQMCGHIARRAVRNGSPELARRMLDLQLAVTLAGLADTGAPLAAAPQPEHERRLAAVLLRIEAARIAAASGRPRVAARAWKQVERDVASVPLAAFEDMERRTVLRYVGETGFLFPSYAAAVEFMGRLALRLPATDPRRDEARIGWISAVETWWGDRARADAMAQEAIADIRAAPEGRSAALVSLLMLRAALVEPGNPALSTRLTREAYEIVSREPGRVSDRIDLLLDMAADQTDRGLALALLAEAQKLRLAAGDIELKTQVRLDLKRAFQAFDDGDGALALQLGEAAVASLVAAGRKEHWTIVDPARSLAGIYAALGRMEDARRTYETYVFPRSNPALVGEEKAIADQLGLANLEAYYAPDRRTVETLDTLLDRARRRVKADRDLPGRILRAQAFAHYGIGDGVRARAAALEALRTEGPPATDTATAQEDRKLLETLVGADWQAAGGETMP